MLNILISRYWLVATVCFLMYTKVGQTQMEDDDDDLSLDNVAVVNYTTEVKSLTPNSLLGWYKLTNGLLSVVHSKSSETIDIVLELFKGKRIVFPDTVYEFLRVQYGMFACVVVGLLFTVSMTVTGLIFFCCRMCGNCGAKRVQVVTKTTSVWRKVLILSLIILLAFILPAAIVVFLINGSLNTSFVVTEKTIHTSLYDAEVFVNNTQVQVEYLAKTGVNKAVDGLLKRIDNVPAFIEGKLPGLDMKDYLEATKIPLFGWLQIVKGLTNASTENDYVNNVYQTSVVAKLTELRDKLTEWKAKCEDENCKNIHPEVFTLSDSFVVDVNSMLNDAMNKFSSLEQEDYNRILLNIVDEMKSVPVQIIKEISPIQTEIKSDLLAYREEVLGSEHLKELGNFTDLAREKIQQAQQETKKIFPELHKYDKIRWYVGLGVGIVITVVAGGLLLGLFSGICGYHHDRQATKRTTLSNGGGLILMFTVYWMFLFAGLLMLLTTVMFAGGGVVETYLCRSLFETNYTTLDQVMGAIKQKAFINDSNILRNIVPSVVLRKCAGNGTVYGAFNLENLNISDMFNYEERLKLDDREQQLKNIKFPEPKFITPHAEIAFKTLIEAYDVNMTDGTEKLNHSFIVGYEDQVKLIHKITAPFVEEFNATIDEINSNLTTLEEQREELKDMLLNLAKQMVDLKEGTIKVNEEVILLENKLKSVIPTMSRESIEEFINESKSFGDHIIQVVLENFEQKLAPCKILWNIFDSFRTVTCKYYVQPLNGIWFAIGWSLFFFIPTIIISTKLSKHFFRMNYVSTDEKDEKSDYDIELKNGYKVKPDNVWHSPSHL